MAWDPDVLNPSQPNFLVLAPGVPAIDVIDTASLQLQKAYYLRTDLSGPVCLAASTARTTFAAGTSTTSLPTGTNFILGSGDLSYWRSGGQGGGPRAPEPRWQWRGPRVRRRWLHPHPAGQRCAACGPDLTSSGSVDLAGPVDGVYPIPDDPDNQAGPWHVRVVWSTPGPGGGAVPHVGMLSPADFADSRAIAGVGRSGDRPLSAYSGSLGQGAQTTLFYDKYTASLATVSSTAVDGTEAAMVLDASFDPSLPFPATVKAMGPLALSPTAAPSPGPGSC